MFLRLVERKTIFNLSVYTRVTRNHFVFKKYPGLEQNKINSEFLLRKFLPTCVSRLGVNFLRSYWFVFRSSFYNKNVLDQSEVLHSSGKI